MAKTSSRLKFSALHYSTSIIFKFRNKWLNRPYWNMVFLSYISLSLPLYKVAVRPHSCQTKTHELSQKCCRSLWQRHVFLSWLPEKQKKRDPKTNDDMEFFFIIIILSSYKHQCARDGMDENFFEATIYFFCFCCCCCWQSLAVLWWFAFINDLQQQSHLKLV